MITPKNLEVLNKYEYLLAALGEDKFFKSLQNIVGDNLDYLFKDDLMEVYDQFIINMYSKHVKNSEAYKFFDKKYSNLN